MMTDSANIPSTEVFSYPVPSVAEFFMLAKKIEAVENVDGTRGGVNVSYDADGDIARITAVIPLERIDQPDGSQLIKPVNFLK